jgi:hypothetical protein
MSLDTHLPALQRLAQGLVALRDGQIGAHAFSESARAETALINALPPRFGPVLLGLLDRLESSALFDAESCSFSQRDLLDSLQLWLDKAEQALRA